MKIRKTSIARLNSMKKYYAKPHVKTRIKEYLARPEIKEREELRKRATPRNALSVSLNRALKKCPTENAITIDDLVEMWSSAKGKCAISGIEMTWRKGRVLPTSISMDRIDPFGGYTKNNVRLICHAFNMFRGRMTDSEMLTMATAIVSNMERNSPEPNWQPHLITNDDDRAWFH